MLQKKDFARALLECRTAIQTMPKDPEGYYELGLAYVGSHDLQNAVYSFQKTLSLKPNHVGAQLQLAEMMASTSDQSNLKNAESRMNEVLKSDPKNTEALDTLALTQLKLGDTNTAVEDLNKALGTAPTSLRTSILLAQVKISQHDVKGAEEVLKKACQNDPKSADAQTVLAYFLEAQKRFPESEESLQKAIQLNPNDGPALLALGKLQFYLGQKQEAEGSFQRLSALPDKAYKAVYGSVLFQEGHREEGVREFEKIFQADPSDRNARTRLVAAYWAVGRRVDAEKLLDAALKKNPSDADALLQRGQIFNLTGRYGQAESDLNAVLHLTPNSAEAHYALSQVHAGAGNILQERQELSDALRLKPGLLGARIALANVLIRTNGAKSALQILDEAPADQRQSLTVLVSRNWAMMAVGDMSGARKGIDLGLKQQRSSDLLVQDGLWKLQNGNTNGGRTALEDALALNGTDLRALEALYSSYVDKKESAAGAFKIREYAGHVPQSAPVQYFLGKVLIANRQNDDGRTALVSALKLDPNLDGAALALIQLDMVEGKFDSARNTLTARLASNPKDTLARLWLANLDEKNGDHASALKGYQQVVEAEPKNAQALNNLAYLLVDYKNQPDEALQYAQKAQEISPTNPNYADTVGWVLYRKGLYSLAAKNFQDAVAKPGAATVCNYHLAMAYAKLGDREHGLAALNVALRRDPKLPEAGEAAQMLRQ